MLRAARAGLALHGLAIESLVANRLLPAHSPDPWLASLAERQRAALDGVTAATGLVAPHLVPRLVREPGLADLAELFVPPPREPGRAARSEPEIEDRLAADGVLVWRLSLPGAVRADLGLVRRGDELVVDAGPFRRVLPLPAALRRCAVAGASFEGASFGRHAGLAVRFAPDPDRWPESTLNGQPPFG